MRLEIEIKHSVKESAAITIAKAIKQAAAVIAAAHVTGAASIASVTTHVASIAHTFTATPVAAFSSGRGIANARHTGE